MLAGGGGGEREMRNICWRRQETQLHTVSFAKYARMHATKKAQSETNTADNEYNNNKMVNRTF